LPTCDTLIRNVQILDGSGSEPLHGAVAISDGRIQAIGDLSGYSAAETLDGNAHVLAPGFIDVHTHDDLCVIRAPEMLPKLSQGVTTVIVGNCGISAAPVRLSRGFPDPMNLLGEEDAFHYPTFAEYASAVASAKPTVNVAALVGHTALRNNHLDRLDRAASASEIAAMQKELGEALDHGAIGLSTGLAYLSANSASVEEVQRLTEVLTGTGAVYTTHLRSETDHVLPAMDEAFQVGQKARVPVIVSHLKCAGVDNWGRSPEVLQSLELARANQAVGCDCYPYAASSSTLDLRQVDERVTITITWSKSHPDFTGQNLADIAATWGVSQLEAARRLEPAGAIYHSISEDDMRAILRNPATMIGSDGLPNDPLPHPRLWGTFPRVLGRYSRDLRLFSVAEAIRKMTSLPAETFRLQSRGRIQEGYLADLVLFDATRILDTATFTVPVSPSVGIEAVWVNGVLSYREGSYTGRRGGQFLSRERN